MNNINTSKKITILIPALNEEKHIETTVMEILQAGHEKLDEFEVIVFDDGSQDRTGVIIDQLALQHKEIRPVHHNQPMGIGYSIHEGIRMARYEYFMGIPGDHSYPKSTLLTMFSAIGMADYVIGYRKNRKDNLPVYRYMISSVLVGVVSLLSGRWLELKDYSSPAIYPVKILRVLDLVETGYAFQIEMTVKLLRTGVSIRQIPVEMNLSTKDNTNAIKISTLRDVIRIIWCLLWKRV